MRNKRIDIYTVFFVVAVVVLSGLTGLFSIISSPNLSSTAIIKSQGTWAEDDTAKTFGLSISHDKYANKKTGIVPSNPFIILEELNSKNCRYVNQVKYNLKSVDLTAAVGNNQLKFHIKREKTKGSYYYADDVSSENIDGYTVNSGIVLVYINNNLVGTQNYNFEQEDSNLDFWHNTKNVNFEWNKYYEVKLVLAFRYMTLYDIHSVPVWCYKGIATTTIRFNDTIAPTGELSGVTNGGETNTNVTFSWGDSRAIANWSWDNGNYTNRKIEIDNGKEGTHTIVLTDQVGLSNTYTFKIDKTAPVSNFEYPKYGETRYTAGNINFAPTDNLSQIVRREVKFGESGTWVSNQTEATNCEYNVQFQGDEIIVPANESNNGKWYFRATDSAGNTSKAECVELMRLSFGNQNRIRDAYKQNTWYNITLPTSFTEEKHFVYTAASYENALAFATSKEWYYRVQPLSNGNWKYVSSANSNLSQEYSDRATLDAVVNKYASSYISERKIAKNGRNAYGQIINDNLVEDETALTHQHLAARYFMTLDLPVYFLDADFKFEDPGFAVKTCVLIKMVGDDDNPVDGIEVELQYDVTVGSQIFSDVDNKQGYYLVTEKDEAGNEEQYYVYIDVSAPVLETYATFGNGKFEKTTFDEELVGEHAGTFRYLSLNLSTISDSIDEYTTIKITGRKLDEVYFVQGDELPFLDGVEYYGKYDIEVYDRSGNSLVFFVTIAGEQPYLSTSSLTSETSCRLTLNVNDKTNAITDLKLFRILHDGTYVELSQDHKEVTVDTSTLQYTLTAGGKYTIWYQDLYERTVECEPIFYLKGLPTATLSGVVDGGITNRNVTLRFNDDDKLILYKVENGVRTEVATNEYFSCVFDETTQKGTAFITANVETSGSYVFFLYKADEMSLFVEYTFSIDCIIAPIYIIDEHGNEIAKNSFTNKPFYLSWNETVSLRYYTDTTPGGELGAIRYELGKPLTINGMYYFTLRDTVGNEESFTILLDTVVSYQIGGEYKQLGEHEYMAKNDLQFTITENNAVQLFDPTPAVVNGGMITLEGNYKIRIIDAYGNSATIKILIDKTAPIIILDGVENGGYTKNTVTVTIIDTAELFLVSKNNQILMALENGTIFDIEGSYRIMAVDEVGNTTVATFTINRRVPFESNIPNTGITTNAVTFKFLGTLENEVIQKDGERILTKTKYTEAGFYDIFAVDTIGNEFYFSFTILPVRIPALRLENLTDILVTATRNNLAYGIEITDSTLNLIEEGNYVLSFNDTRKNIEYSFNITIDNSVSVSSSIPNHSFTADIVKIDFGETVTQEVKLEGKVIKPSKQYTKAGNYEIKASDDIGNEIVLEFRIMPARMRELKLENLTDVELLLVTKDNKEFGVTIDKNHELYLTDNGNYVLFFQRITGEVFNLICEVDNTKPTVEIDKEPGAFKATNASKENVTATLSCNGAEAIEYKIGKKISGAGHYTLTITDDLGNTNEYSFDITEPLNWAAYASIGGLGLLGAVALIVVLKAKWRVKTR